MRGRLPDARRSARAGPTRRAAAGPAAATPPASPGRARAPRRRGAPADARRSGSRGSSDRGDDVRGQRPNAHAARASIRSVRRRAALRPYPPSENATWVRERHPRRRRGPAVCSCSSKLGVTGGRQRLRVQRVPEREVVLLDGEDVREVRRRLDREVETTAAPAPTFSTTIRSCIASETKRSRTLDRESCGEITDDGVAEVRTLPSSTRPVPTRAAVGSPVDPQAEQREETRVVGEEPARLPAMSPRSSQMQKVEPSRIVSDTWLRIPDDAATARLRQRLRTIRRR